MRQKQQNFIPPELSETAKEYGLPVGRIFDFEFLYAVESSTAIWVKYLSKEIMVPRSLFPFCFDVEEIRQERAEKKRREFDALAASVWRILNY